MLNKITLNPFEPILKKEKENKRWGKDLIFLILAIGFLFGFGLGVRPLSNPDEGRYAEIAREMAVSEDFISPRLNDVLYFEKPPLFYWLESGAIKLFGLQEWSLRLLPAMFALLGCLMVYSVGRQLFGRTTGLISAAVLSTSILYYAMSRVVILDMVVSVLLSGALFSFLLGMREPRGRIRRLYLWGFYACVALATLTKGLIGVVLPTMVVGIWVLVLWEWRILFPLYLPSGLALFFLIAAPWHILVAEPHPEFLHFYFIREHFLRYMTGIHHRNKPIWFFIPILIGGLLPWTAFLIQTIAHHISISWSLRRQHKENIFFMIWAAVGFGFFSLSKSKLASYILPIWPALALLIGNYLAFLVRVNPSRYSRAGMGGRISTSMTVLLLLMAALIIGSLLILPYFYAPIEPRRFKIYQYTLMAIVVAGVMVTWIMHRFRGFRGVLVSLTVTTALFLMILNNSFTLFDTRSVKVLAETLKPRLQRGDEVVSYHNYYQDLPVYLERRITVVEWVGELEFGTKVEDASDWMIDEATFWRRWQGPGTVYMLMSQIDYEKLLAERRGAFYLIAQTQRNVLVANRE